MNSSALHAFGKELLKAKNIELATNAKQKIEQKQRDDSKQRKDENIKWQTKHFEEHGENWIYVNPLVNRLKKKQLN